MNGYLIFILTVIIGGYLLDLFVEILNLHCAGRNLPKEFIGYYDQQRYAKSQDYLKITTRFNLFKEGFSTIVIVSFILLGGFNFVDLFARSLVRNSIPAGLIFVGILVFASQLLGIPFAIYRTFVIEERFGFNKTTIKTFILDIVKSWILLALIGGVIFSLVVLFFEKAGGLAWVYCWGAVTLFQLLITFIAPVVIMPLFNKFIPLEDGELKQQIENYAKSQSFALQGVFKMDGSRRSTKSNAFFTGFGKFRRIALFDTLIAKHTVSELVSVLAHEIGHYKKKHILKNIFISIISSGVMFFFLSMFLKNPNLFAAFKMQNISVYASLLFFGFLYTPISMVLSVFENILSRKYEYQADQFAVETYKNPQAMIEALKKLTVDNLSNLTPHPCKVFLEYSHPPVLKRIERICSL